MQLSSFSDAIRSKSRHGQFRMVGREPETQAAAAGAESFSLPPPRYIYPPLWTERTGATAPCILIFNLITPSHLAGFCTVENLLTKRN